MKIGLVRKGENIIRICEYDDIRGKGEIAHMIAELELIKLDLLEMWDDYDLKEVMMMETKKILLLGYEDTKLLDFLRNDFDVIHTQDRVTNKDISNISPDRIISWGYRHILDEDVVKEHKDIVNLHPAYLPYNRGAYSNFFSFLDDTSKGFTIHFIDKGIDTGKIILQKELYDFYNDNSTLKDTYYHLRFSLEDFFINNFDHVMNVNFDDLPLQKDKGTYHEVEEFENLIPYLNLNSKWKLWDTKVSDIKYLSNFVEDVQLSEIGWEKYDKEIWEVRK